MFSSLKFQDFTHLLLTVLLPVIKDENLTLILPFFLTLIQCTSETLRIVIANVYKYLCLPLPFWYKCVFYVPVFLSNPKITRLCIFISCERIENKADFWLTFFNVLQVCGILFLPRARVYNHKDTVQRKQRLSHT